MVFETLIISFTALVLQVFSLNRGMSQFACRFNICLNIFCTLICLVECGKCPLNGLHKSVDFDACSSYKSNYKDLQNTFTGYFSLDHALGWSESVCHSSEFFYLSTMLDGFNSEVHNSKIGILDVKWSGVRAASPNKSNKEHVNASWSPDHRIYHFPDGGAVACSLFDRELAHDMAPSVNRVDHTVLSSCEGHLLHQKETSSFLKNLEIEKFQFVGASSPPVYISPNKLDWGQSLLYHPSVAFLRLENICSESVLEVYEPFSTNNQFYPFNFSKVVLGPGEVAIISFVFLPKWLGLSSAELILQTSFGGFLVEAHGLAVESPHKLRSLEGLEVSSGGRLSRKLSLLNPYAESIHLEEVTARFTVYGGNSPHLVEAICSKVDPRFTYEHSFSDSKTESSAGSRKFNFVDMEIKPLSNWVISPHKTESILEIAFSPDSEGQLLGAICMQLVRPLEGEKDTLVVPFEAEFNTTATWKDKGGPLSVFIESIGCSNVGETTVSVSVGNNAFHVSKIVRISEVYNRKGMLKIKYPEGLLLFPGTVTQVATVTYESSSVKYDPFIEIDEVNMSCILQILTNDTISPILEIPCWEIFGVCSRQLEELPSRQPDTVFSNKRTGCLTSSANLPFAIKAIGDMDDFMLQNWRGQSTMSGLHVLDDHELLFPIVPIGNYSSKSFSVNNPSQQPVIVQLILNEGEIIGNCKTHQNHLQQFSSSSFFLEGSSKPSRYGFSIINSTVTEAYLHPYGSAELGPILFHPSNPCEWKSSALIRNNLSGVEWLSLHGSGGYLSLALLEGSKLVHRLDFNINFLWPLNVSPPDVTPDNDGTSSECHKPLSKKLFAVNTGDFPVKVQRIHVSGRECELDGFIVHNCEGFTLEPGESVELGILYRSDFSEPVVHRDLELVLAAGLLVIPMKASLPLHALNFCRKSIFWFRVKKCCLTIVFVAILISLLLRFLIPQMTPAGSLDCLIKGGNDCNNFENPKDKSSLLDCKKGSRKSCSRSIQRDEAVAIKSDVACSNCQHGNLKHGIVAELTNLPVVSQTENAPSSDVPVPKETVASPYLISKSVPVESPGKIEVVQHVSLTVKTCRDKRRRSRKRKGAASGLTALIEEVSSSQSGNSTPPSPLSPFTSASSEETCSPYVKKQPPDSSSPCSVPGGSSGKGKEGELGKKLNGFGPETVGHTGHSRNCSGNLLSSQLLPVLRKTGSKPMLLPSATFPGAARLCPSRLAISPHARAPGPTFPNAVEAEEQASSDDSFAYDIWGNHFSGIHLITRPNDPPGMTPEAIGGNSDSFFLRGPQQTLPRKFPPKSVNSSYEQG